MERVGSVAALIALSAVGDPAAVAIVDALDEEARLVVAAQREPPPARLAWMRAHSGEEWSAARLAHVEQRAFVEIRRALQRRGLWQS